MTEPKAEYMTESTEPFHWKWVESMRRWVVYENRGFNMATQCHYFEVVCTCGTAERAAQVCESLIQSRSTDAPEARGGAFQLPEHDRDCQARFTTGRCNCSASKALSTPQQEAPIEADGTITKALNMVNSGLEVANVALGDWPTEHRRDIARMHDGLCFARNALTALSSRSGVWVSKADLGCLIADRIELFRQSGTLSMADTDELLARYKQSLEQSE